MKNNTKNRVTTNIVISGLIIALIAAAGYMFVLSPLSAKKQEQRENITRAQSLLDRAGKDLLTARQFEAQHPQVVSANEELVKNFPETADIESLTNAVTDAARRAGIPAKGIVSISTQTPAIYTAPAKPAPAPTGTPAPDGTPAPGADGTTLAPQGTQPGSKMATVEISVNLKGSPDSLIAFSKNVADLSRVVRVTGVTLSVASGEGTLTLSGTSYLYQSIPLPSATEESQEPAVVEDTQG